MLTFVKCPITYKKCLIWYSNFGLKPHINGKLRWFDVIQIDPKYKSDWPLHIHEFTHNKQLWKNPFTWTYKYFSDDRFKLRQEAEAYGNQVTYGADLERCAELLSKNYNLHISTVSAIEWIKRYMEPNRKEI